MLWSNKIRLSTYFFGLCFLLIFAIAIATPSQINSYNDISTTSALLPLNSSTSLLQSLPTTTTTTLSNIFQSQAQTFLSDDDCLVSEIPLWSLNPPISSTRYCHFEVKMITTFPKYNSETAIIHKTQIPVSTPSYETEIKFTFEQYPSKFSKIVELVYDISNPNSGTGPEYISLNPPQIQVVSQIRPTVTFNGPKDTGNYMLRISDMSLNNNEAINTPILIQSSSFQVQSLCNYQYFRLNVDCPDPDTCTPFSYCKCKYNQTPTNNCADAFIFDDDTLQGLVTRPANDYGDSTLYFYIGQTVTITAPANSFDSESFTPRIYAYPTSNNDFGGMRTIFLDTIDLTDPVYTFRIESSTSSLLSDLSNNPDLFSLELSLCGFQCFTMPIKIHIDKCKYMNMHVKLPEERCFEQGMDHECDLIQKKCICKPGWYGKQCSIQINHSQLSSTSDINEPQYISIYNPQNISFTYDQIEDNDYIQDVRSYNERTEVDNYGNEILIISFQLFDLPLFPEPTPTSQEVFVRFEFTSTNIEDDLNVQLEWAYTIGSSTYCGDPSPCDPSHTTSCFQPTTEASPQCSCKPNYYGLNCNYHFGQLTPLQPPQPTLDGKVYFGQRFQWIDGTGQLPTSSISFNLIPYNGTRFETEPSSGDQNAIKILAMPFHSYWLSPVPSLDIEMYHYPFQRFYIHIYNVINDGGITDGVTVQYITTYQLEDCTDVERIAVADPPSTGQLPICVLKNTRFCNTGWYRRPGYLPENYLAHIPCFCSSHLQDLNYFNNPQQYQQQQKVDHQPIQRQEYIFGEYCQTTLTLPLTDITIIPVLLWPYFPEFHTVNGYPRINMNNFRIGDSQEITFGAPFGEQFFVHASSNLTSIPLSFFYEMPLFEDTIFYQYYFNQISTPIYTIMPYPWLEAPFVSEQQTPYVKSRCKMESFNFNFHTQRLFQIGENDPKYTINPLEFDIKCECFNGLQSEFGPRCDTRFAWKENEFYNRYKVMKSGDEIEFYLTTETFSTQPLPQYKFVWAMRNLPIPIPAIVTLVSNQIGVYQTILPDFPYDVEYVSLVEMTQFVEVLDLRFRRHVWSLRSSSSNARIYRNLCDQVYHYGSTLPPTAPVPYQCSHWNQCIPTATTIEEQCNLNNINGQCFNSTIFGINGACEYSFWFQTTYITYDSTDIQLLTPIFHLYSLTNEYPLYFTRLIGEVIDIVNVDVTIKSSSDQGVPVLSTPITQADRIYGLELNSPPFIPNEQYTLSFILTLSDVTSTQLSFSIQVIFEKSCQFFNNYVPYYYLTQSLMPDGPSIPPFIPCNIDGGECSLYDGGQQLNEFACNKLPFSGGSYAGLILRDENIDFIPTKFGELIPFSITNHESTSVIIGKIRTIPYIYGGNAYVEHIELLLQPNEKYTFLVPFYPDLGFALDETSGMMTVYVTIGNVDDSIDDFPTIQFEKFFSDFNHNYIQLSACTDFCDQSNTLFCYEDPISSTATCQCREQFVGSDCTTPLTITTKPKVLPIIGTDELSYTDTGTYHYWGQSINFTFSPFTGNENSRLTIQLVIGPNYKTDPLHILSIVEYEVIGSIADSIEKTIILPSIPPTDLIDDYWAHSFFIITIIDSDNFIQTNIFKYAIPMMNSCQWLEQYRINDVRPTRFCDLSHTKKCIPHALSLAEICECTSSLSTSSLGLNSNVIGLQEQELYYGESCDGIVRIHANEYLYPSQPVQITVIQDRLGTYPISLQLIPTIDDNEIFSIDWSPSKHTIIIPEDYHTSQYLLQRKLPYTIDTNPLLLQYKFRLIYDDEQFLHIDSPSIFKMVDSCYYMSVVNHPSICSYNVDTTTTIISPTLQCRPHDPKQEFCTCNTGFFGPQCRLQLTIEDIPQLYDTQLIFPMNTKIKIKYNYYFQSNEQYLDPNQYLQIMDSNGLFNPIANDPTQFELKNDWTDYIVGRFSPWLDLFDSELQFNKDTKNNHIENIFELTTTIFTNLEDDINHIYTATYWLIPPHVYQLKITELIPITFMFKQQQSSLPQQQLQYQDPCVMLSSSTNMGTTFTCDNPHHLFAYNSKQQCDPILKRCVCADGFFGEKCDYFLHMASSSSLNSLQHDKLPPNFQINSFISQNFPGTNIQFQLQQSIQSFYEIDVSSYNGDENNNNNNDDIQFETTQSFNNNIGPTITLPNDENEIIGYELLLNDPTTNTQYSILEPFQILSECSECIAAHTLRCNDTTALDPDYSIAESGSRCVCLRGYWGNNCEQKVQFTDDTVTTQYYTWDPVSYIYSIHDFFEMKFEMYSTAPDPATDLGYEEYKYMMVFGDNYNIFQEEVIEDGIGSKIYLWDFAGKSISHSTHTLEKPYTTYYLVVVWQTTSYSIAQISTPIIEIRIHSPCSWSHIIGQPCYLPGVDTLDGCYINTTTVPTTVECDCINTEDETFFGKYCEIQIFAHNENNIISDISDEWLSLRNFNENVHFPAGMSVKLIYNKYFMHLITNLALNTTNNFMHYDMYSSVESDVGLLAPFTLQKLLPNELDSIPKDQMIEFYARPTDYSLTVTNAGLIFFLHRWPSVNHDDIGYKPLSYDDTPILLSDRSEWINFEGLEVPTIGPVSIDTSTRRVRIEWTNTLKPITLFPEPIFYRFTLYIRSSSNPITSLNELLLTTTNKNEYTPFPQVPGDATLPIVKSYFTNEESQSKSINNNMIWARQRIPDGSTTIPIVQSVEVELPPHITITSTQKAYILMHPNYISSSMSLPNDYELLYQMVDLSTISPPLTSLPDWCQQTTLNCPENSSCNKYTKSCRCNNDNEVMNDNSTACVQDIPITTPTQLSTSPLVNCPLKHNICQYPFIPSPQYCNECIIPTPILRNLTRTTMLYFDSTTIPITLLQNEKLQYGFFQLLSIELSAALGLYIDDIYDTTQGSSTQSQSYPNSGHVKEYNNNENLTIYDNNLCKEKLTTYPLSHGRGNNYSYDKIIVTIYMDCGIINDNNNIFPFLQKRFNYLEYLLKSIFVSQPITPPQQSPPQQQSSSSSVQIYYYPQSTEINKKYIPWTITSLFSSITTTIMSQTFQSLTTPLSLLQYKLFYPTTLSTDNLRGIRQPLTTYCQLWVYNDDNTSSILSTNILTVKPCPSIQISKTSKYWSTCQQSTLLNEQEQQKVKKLEPICIDLFGFQYPSSTTTWCKGINYYPRYPITTQLITPCLSSSPTTSTTIDITSPLLNLQYKVLPISSIIDQSTSSTYSPFQSILSLPTLNADDYITLQWEYNGSDSNTVAIYIDNIISILTTPNDISTIPTTLSNSGTSIYIRSFPAKQQFATFKIPSYIQTRSDNNNSNGSTFRLVLIQNVTNTISTTNTFTINNNYKNCDHCKSKQCNLLQSTAPCLPPIKKSFQIGLIDHTKEKYQCHPLCQSCNTTTGECDCDNITTSPFIGLNCNIPNCNDNDNKQSQLSLLPPSSTLSCNGRGYNPQFIITTPNQPTINTSCQPISESNPCICNPTTFWSGFNCNECKLSTNSLCSIIGSNGHNNECTKCICKLGYYGQYCQHRALYGSITFELLKPTTSSNIHHYFDNESLASSQSLVTTATSTSTTQPPQYSIILNVENKYSKKFSSSILSSLSSKSSDIAQEFMNILQELPAGDILDILPLHAKKQLILDLAITLGLDPNSGIELLRALRIITIQQQKQQPQSFQLEEEEEVQLSSSSFSILATPKVTNQTTVLSFIMSSSTPSNTSSSPSSSNDDDESTTTMNDLYGQWKNLKENFSTSPIANTPATTNVPELGITQRALDSFDPNCQEHEITIEGGKCPIGTNPFEDPLIPEEPPRKGLSTGAIIGIVLGITLPIILIIIIAILCWYANKNKVWCCAEPERRNKDGSSKTNNETEMSIATNLSGTARSDHEDPMSDTNTRPTKGVYTGKMSMDQSSQKTVDLIPIAPDPKDPLPENWTKWKHKDTDQIFYVNSETMVSQRHAPGTQAQNKGKWF